MELNKKVIGGSIILLITFNLFNLLNFLFQFSMARLLTLIEYGVLATLFSLVYVLGIFSESIQTIVAKYSSNERNIGKIKNLLKKTVRKSLVVSVYLLIVYLIAAIPLSSILNIEYSLFFITGFIIFASFLAPIPRGILQGRKKFGTLGMNLVLEGATKIIFGVIIVVVFSSLGFFYMRTHGAVFSAVFASLLAMAVAFLTLKEVLKSKEEEIKTDGIYIYARPAFVINLVIFVFFSLDIIFAKIFFNPETAGAYAIASILAKTVFLGVQPISKAMFPLSSEKSKDKKEAEKILGNAMIIISALLVIALLIFFFFPDLIVYIFSGKIIPLSSSVLFWISLAFAIMAITNLVLFYKLSIGQTKGYQYLFIFIVLQVSLLSYFSSNPLAFVFALIVSSAAFLWGALFLIRD